MATKDDAQTKSKPIKKVRFMRQDDKEKNKLALQQVKDEPSSKEPKRFSIKIPDLQKNVPATNANT